METFTDKIYLSRRRDDGNLYEKKTLIEFKRKSIDILSLRKMNNLILDQISHDFLLQLYNNSNEEFGFAKFYSEKIQEALE